MLLPRVSLAVISAASVLGVAAASSAVADTTAGSDTLFSAASLASLELRASDVQPPADTGADEQDPGTIPQSPSLAVKYGEQSDQWWWTIGAGAAYAFSESAMDYRLNLSVTRFIVDDFEFGAEFDAWYFAQEGHDAVGLSAALLFRWHFLRDQSRDMWSLFVEAGIGPLVTSEEVPDGGLHFNFLPKAGVGGTLRLGDGPERLVGGVRWHHISNARIRGEDRNPSRDGLQIYAGVTFPF